ncbi:GNAT family N-acetyltransferase [Gloeobacter kilaueensis]|nr:GNAT family N-acetyltransferase [Gloeobacter kilaueensis]
MLATIETERLILRPLTPADEEDLYRLWSDPNVVRYTSLVSLTREQVHDFIERWIHYGDHPGHGAWAIVVRDPRVFAGYCFLRFLFDTSDTELGYGLAQAFWGRGYMSEAVQAVLAWGLDRGLERIVAAAMPENIASWRVMEKCGMRFEGLQDYRGTLDRFYAIGRAAKKQQGRLL